MEAVEIITDHKYFDKMCRVCLKCDEAEEIEAFKPLLYQLFKKLMDIPEENNPNLPKGLCKECKLCLENISIFIETCKTNQAKWEEKYSNGARSKENDESSMSIEKEDTFDKELEGNQSNMLKNINLFDDCFEIKQECLDIPMEDIKVIDEDLTLNNKNNNDKTSELKMACSDSDEDVETGIECMDEMTNTSPEIKNAREEVTLDYLPEKSRILYEKQYNRFVMWCKSKKISKYSENVLIAYISEKAKILKSSSLWSYYSMLRATLSAKHDIDISQFKKLIAFLKKLSVGYKPVKSKTFTDYEIWKFLRNAPDEMYLLKKVILIIAIAGACRRDELVKMRVNDIQDRQSVLICTIPDSKTRKSRVFTIINSTQENSIDYLALFRKYIALRPATVKTPRLFLKYDKGKCANQVVGMNTIAKIPADIAKYLNLPESHLYTGHCFRRSSAILLVNGGGFKTQLKRHGGW